MNEYEKLYNAVCNRDDFQNRYIHLKWFDYKAEEPYSSKQTVDDTPKCPIILHETYSTLMPMHLYLHCKTMPNCWAMSYETSIKDSIRKISADYHKGEKCDECDELIT